MNTQMLQKVRDAIANAGPDHLDMDTWRSQRIFNDDHEEVPEFEEDGVSLTQCGSVMCIAGWTVFLSDPSNEFLVNDDSRVARRACKLLELSAGQADSLFLFSMWSEEYQERLKWDGESEYDLVLEILDHMIEHGKLPWNYQEQVRY